MTFPSKVFPSSGLEPDQSQVAGGDERGVGLRDADADRDDVRAGDDEEQLAGRAGRREMADVDPSASHDPVERGADLAVVRHGAGVLGLEAGDLDV